jgi:hypothetical protein
MIVQNCESFAITLDRERIGWRDWRCIRDESLLDVANGIRALGHYPAFGNGRKFLSLMGADL